jgi:hypothetical protein
MRRKVFAIAVSTALGIAACGSPQAPEIGPRGTLRFDGEPGEAVLAVDGTRLGPLSMFSERGVLLKPGAHRIAVRADGYFPEYRMVEVVEGRVELIKIALRPIPK